MKIILDNIVFSIQKSGGISVVWYEIIQRLVKEKNIDLKFIEYSNSNLNIFRKKFTVDNSFLYQKAKWNSIKRYFNPNIDEKEQFIFHSSYYRFSQNKKAINISTVHDFTYELYRGGLRKWIHSFQKFRAIRHSDYIICVSENTKKDLLRLLPDVQPDKVHVIFNGVSENYFPLKDSSKFKYTNVEPLDYVLFVGLRDDYKKFDVAVKLAAKLNKKLFIIGGGNLNANEYILLDSNIESNSYQHFTRPTDSELNVLYNFAYCLLYPSEYEGFGIPIIEAQRAGCPVVAYNAGATKEVAGNNPLLFDSFDIDIIAKKTQSNLEDATKRALIVSGGLNNAMRFSWKENYSEVLKLYQLAYRNKLS